MSEIKFRAWVFGDLDEGANPFMADVYAIVFEPEGPCVQWEEFDEISCPGEFALMQYTGLKDKNGKEIYEGDVVRYKYDCDSPWAANAVGTISWQSTGFHLSCFKGEYGLVQGWLVSIPHADGKLLEVIGNVYENPELVKHG
jgi:uncharacterized phage protein (TIGR01671 family)